MNVISFTAPTIETETGRLSPRQYLVALLALSLSLTGCQQYRAVGSIPDDKPISASACIDPLATDGSAPRFVLPADFEYEQSMALSLPQPVEQEVVSQDEPDVAKRDGWARVRFDVDRNGRVTNVRALEASELGYGARAEQLLASWQFKPGRVDGEPVPFENMEWMVIFSKELTPGGKAAVAAVLVPLVILTAGVLLILAVAGGGGSTSGSGSPPSVKILNTP